MAKVQEGPGARERFLGGSEALADDVREVVVDDVLLGVHHQRQALHAEGLCGGDRDEQDARAGGERVDALDIERDFERPRGLVLLAGAIARLLHGRRAALDADGLEGGHPVRAGHVLLTAHVGQAKRVVEDMEVVGHGVAAV